MDRKISDHDLRRLEKLYGVSEGNEHVVTKLRKARKNLVREGQGGDSKTNYWPDLSTPGNMPDINPDNNIDWTRANHIVIVGGGSAGWMAASNLFLHSKVLSKLPEYLQGEQFKERFKNLKVTLIESGDIDAIGVGEGTTPLIRELIDGMELNIDDMNGTKKLGIRYNNWYSSNDSKFNKYIHPFWESEESNPDRLMHKLSYEQVQEELDDDVFQTTNYSYHLEVSKFTPKLKEKCLSAGLNHIISTVTDCEFDDKGYIKSVILDDNTKIYGDLFIDCTGFRRFLINKFNPKYISFPVPLPCDRAIATHLDGDNPMDGYHTDATALSSGWVWNIPLQDKTGTGYVYSSKFISDEDAKKEFNEYLGTNQDFRVIKWKPEFLETNFHKNCIAIGLSFGFHEPMEAQSLVSIQGHCLEMVALLIGRSNLQSFERKSQQFIWGTYAFIMTHYLLSKRDDSPFWKNLQKTRVPKLVKEFWATFGMETDLDQENLEYSKFIDESFDFWEWHSWAYTLLGLNYDYYGKYGDKLKELGVRALPIRPSK